MHVGRLVMESSLGQLTVFEMELVSWIMAKWVQKESPESPTVEFFEAELAREFGVQCRYGPAGAGSPCRAPDAPPPLAGRCPVC
jgi:hypothetical protein